jgi:hypothetical protein
MAADRNQLFNRGQCLLLGFNLEPRSSPLLAGICDFNFIFAQSHTSTALSRQAHIVLANSDVNGRRSRLTGDVIRLVTLAIVPGSRRTGQGALLFSGSKPV